MSTSFYIVDKKNWRSFELGSGMWSHTAHAMHCRNLSVDEFCKAVYIDCDRTFGDLGGGEEVEYARLLGEVIWAFCKVADWDVECRADTLSYADEEYGQRGALLLVGTRYYNGNVPLVEDPCKDLMKLFMSIAAATRPKA